MKISPFCSIAFALYKLLTVVHIPTVLHYKSKTNAADSYSQFRFHHVVQLS